MKRPCLAMVGVLALIVTLMGCDSEPTQPVNVGFIVAGERPAYLRSAQLAVDEVNERGGTVRRARRIGESR